MFNKKKTDIVVLGAGPVGLMAAHVLADRKMDFVLLDRGRRSNTHSYALALHPETMELLDSIGVAERVLDGARCIEKVAFYEGEERRADLDYGTLTMPYPFLTVIGQSELEEILIDALAAKGHKPLWNHRVRFIEEEEGGLKVSVDRLAEGMTGYAMAHIDMQIEKILDYYGHYLIGADGHESLARRITRIGFPEVMPATDYAVFEFKTDAKLPDEMRLIVKEDKTHVFWPLPNGYCRWSFQVRPGEAPIDSLAKDHLLVQMGNRGFPLLDREHLNQFLAENAPWFEGTIEHLRWRMMVRFEHRLAESFGKGRVWLAGDSAHMAPPAGILSMNVGMREALDLVERLGTGNEDAQRQAALASYSEERLAEWKGLIDLEGHLAQSGEADPWVLAHKDRLVGNIPAAGETLRALLGQLHLTAAA